MRPPKKDSAWSGSPTRGAMRSANGIATALLLPAAVAARYERHMRMKRMLLALLFLVPVFSPTSAGAQRAKDSTIVDPDVHRVMFENDHVRVIDARAPRGWKSAMHSHRPMLVIILGSGRQR